MSLIADFSTVTSCLDETFRLVLPERAEEAFPDFPGCAPW